MKFLKKIFGVIPKMSQTGRNQKLVPALSQTPEAPKENIVQDIEDLVKTQYSSEAQTRSQKLKEPKITAVSSLTCGTSAAAVMLRPLKSESLIKTHRNLPEKIKAGNQKNPKAEMPSDLQTCSLVEYPTPSTKLMDFCQPMIEVDNQPAEQKESKTTAAAEKIPKPKPDRKTKALVESKAVVPPSKKKKTVTRKKSKKQPKELNEVGWPMPPPQPTVNLKLMPIPPRPPKMKPTPKLSEFPAFLFNPAKMKREENLVEMQAESSSEGDLLFNQEESAETAETGELHKWEPKRWADALKNIKQMRTIVEAPVDQMGCHKCCDEDADDKTKRFQYLVALMLSSQTKDQITFEVMNRLKKNTCTPSSIAEMELDQLIEILHPVSFYRNKAKYIQNTAKILMDKYDSDIPKNLNEMIKLPGIGPKMAHICMSVAWDLVTGIGVDTHVHRISNRLGWVRYPTKEPEQTRKKLEEWLPPQHWKELNLLLVGFGQTFCTPVRPRCDQCLNKSICPAAKLLQKTLKRKVKEQQDEF